MILRHTRKRQCHTANPDEMIEFEADAVPTAELQLAENVEPDLGNALIKNSYGFRRGIRQVDISALDKRAAVVDPHGHRAPGIQICHAQHRAKRQGPVRRSQCLRINFFAVRRLGSFGIKAGNAVFFCGVLASGERIVLTDAERSERCRPAGGTISGFVADDRGLCTGGEKCRGQRDDGQSSGIARFR